MEINRFVDKASYNVYEYSEKEEEYVVVGKALEEIEDGKSYIVQIEGSNKLHKIDGGVDLVFIELVDMGLFLPNKEPDNEEYRKRKEEKKEKELSKVEELENEIEELKDRLEGIGGTVEYLFQKSLGQNKGK